ncbi:MAG: vWA domain-containing protein, partial [Chloroflexota bacterium]
MQTKRRLALCAAVLSGLLFALTPLVALMQGQATLKILKTDNTDFPNVQVWVQAIGSNSLPMPDLNVGNFKIFEGGAPLDIGSVTPITNPDAELTIGVALDLGQGMKENASSGEQRLAVAQRILRKILEQMTTKDQMEVIGYSGKVEARTNSKERSYTNEKPALNEYIDALAVYPEQGNPICDAANKTLNTTAGRNGTPLVLLIAAGNESGPDVPFCDNVGDSGVRKQIPVFVIGLASDLDVAHLTRMTRDKDRIQIGDKDEQWAPFLSNLLNGLRRQYVLRYTAKAPCDD